MTYYSENESNSSNIDILSRPKFKFKFFKAWCLNITFLIILTIIDTLYGEFFLKNSSDLSI